MLSRDNDVEYVRHNFAICSIWTESGFTNRYMVWVDLKLLNQSGKMVTILQIKKNGIIEKLGFVFNVDTYESGYSDGCLSDPLDPELEAVDQSWAAVCVHGTVLMENKF